VSRETLRGYVPGESLGFDELVLDLLGTDTPPRVQPFDGYWLDIGRPDDYDTANEEWERLKPLLLPSD
jgi:mannose-1-phosphate guanylyltransferase